MNFRLILPTRATWQAALGGLLVALSLPPWGWWPLAFVGIALFETALGESPTRRTSFWRGLTFGSVWMFVGMCWMWFLTPPGYVVAAIMFAALHGLAAAAAPQGPWRAIGRPAAHTLVEAIRLYAPFGGAPLATLPIGQAGGPLLGVVRVGGVLLLTWLVFQFGFALAGPSPFVPAMVRRQRPNARAEWHGLIGVTAAIVVIIVSAVAPDGTRPVCADCQLDVAIVQGGGPQGTRAVDTSAREVVERHLAATATIEAGSVDLVVWPENVVDVAEFATSVELDEITAEAKRIGAPILVGITEDTVNADGESAFLNAQVVVTPDGEVTSRYDKVQRVPFGEYMPMRGLLSALGAPTDLVPRDAVAGADPAVLDLPGGQRVTVVISWEVFFGRRADAGDDAGGTLIINPTNGSSYSGTILQTQQVASSRLRAVEFGRWVVQAAPTGFSAFVEPDGTVLQRTGVSEQAVIVGQVQLTAGRTLYARLGDWPFVVIMLGTLIAAHVVATRRRSEG